MITHVPQILHVLLLQHHGQFPIAALPTDFLVSQLFQSVQLLVLCLPGGLIHEIVTFVIELRFVQGPVVFRLSVCENFDDHATTPAPATSHDTPLSHMSSASPFCSLICWRPRAARRENPYMVAEQPAVGQEARAEHNGLDT